MAKSQLEINFYNNISTVIKHQIDMLNNHSVILKEVLPEYMKKKNGKFKLTDEIILCQIYHLFEEAPEESIADRTYQNIKGGNTSSSAFNVLLIIYNLNDLTSKINERYEYYKEDIILPLINLDALVKPLIKN